MFHLLKEWLRDKFFTSVEDVRYFQTERVLANRSPEERLSFWLGMQTWLGSEQGKAFMAIQQGEYVRIQQALLSKQTPEEQADLLSAFRQQNFVISFEYQVKNRIGILEKKLKVPAE